MRQLGTMRLYGCGGFGINISTHFERVAGQTEAGYAETFPCYIDTSTSNLRSDLNLEHVSLIEDVDGSGKVRRENHVEIAKRTKAILQTHTPKDFNIVVFSASGGSGSVFGPLLMKELLSQGCSVVGVVVGSDESLITATNTRNTLKSLEAIAEKTDAPVVIFYEHNEREIPRSEIDARCQQVIASLGILCSGNNAEMDSRDIGNWVRFNRSTSVSARLALLDVYQTNEDAEGSIDPISIASLLKSGDETPLAIQPEYHTAGYPRGSVKNFTNMHFVIGLGMLPTVYKRIEAVIEEQEKKRAARVNHDKIVNGNDSVEESGLVL